MSSTLRAQVSKKGDPGELLFRAQGLQGELHDGVTMTAKVFTHDEGCLTIYGFANGISWFGCYFEEDSPKESGT